MSEQTKDFLSDVESDILVYVNELPDLEKEAFFSRLADWAYSRHDYITSRIIP